MKIGTQVANALATKTTVGLESTILAHGFLRPKNLELAIAIEKEVLSHAATPSTISVVEGEATIDCGETYLRKICMEDFAKTNIADLAVYMGRKRNAATTVSATLEIGAAAGLTWFATGGLGGVHRDDGGDVSSDFHALATKPCAIVCSGIKSFLDIERSIERLETLGICVVGYQCDKFPLFYSRESEFGLEHTASTLSEVVEIARAQRKLMRSLVILNPVPHKFSIEKREVEHLLASIESSATGKGKSPFILKKLGEHHNLVTANFNLAINNAKLASELAVFESEMYLR